MTVGRQRLTVYQHEARSPPAILLLRYATDRCRCSVPVVGRRGDHRRRRLRRVLRRRRVGGEHGGEQFRHQTRSIAPFCNPLAGAAAFLPGTVRHRTVLGVAHHADQCCPSTGVSLSATGDVQVNGQDAGQFGADERGEGQRERGTVPVQKLGIVQRLGLIAGLFGDRSDIDDDADKHAKT